MHESPLKQTEEASQANASNNEGGEGLSGDNLDKLTKLLSKVEAKLLQRIVQVESTASKVHDLEDDMNAMKLDLARALQPKGPQITDEDVAKWNKNLETTADLEEQIKKLRNELAILDGPKIKADILQIFKVQTNVVGKTDLNPLNEQIRKLEMQLNDSIYESNALRDTLEALQSKVSNNYKELKSDGETVRARVDANDQTLVQHKKQLT